MDLNEKTKNEIDFLGSTNKNMVQNVNPHNSYNTETDHWLVRKKIVINLMRDRKKMIKRRKGVAVVIDQLRTLHKRPMKNLRSKCNRHQ